MRTFLTVLGVSVGIGTVLFLVSLGYGLQNAILSKIMTEDSLLSLDVTAGTSELISISQEDINRIAQIKEVKEVCPLASFAGQITLDNFTGDGIIYATNPSFFSLSGLAQQYGKAFASGDKHEAVISSAGTKLFNLDPTQVIGRRIYLTLFMPKKNEQGIEETEIIKQTDYYTIKGVINDESASYVYVPLGTLNNFSINSYEQLKIKITSDEFMEQARNEIIKMGFLVSSLSDTIDQTKKIFRIIQIVLAFFGLVALIVSAIGMFNTMTIALLERINEIGIMRTIGVTKKDLKMLFLFESVLMGFLGGVGGVAIGYLAGEFANMGFNILARNFGGQVFDLFYSPLWFIIVVVFFSTFIGFLTGVFPSRRAAKLNPLEALRYK